MNAGQSERERERERKKSVLSVHPDDNDEKTP